MQEIDYKDLTPDELDNLIRQRLEEFVFRYKDLTITDKELMKLVKRDLESEFGDFLQFKFRREK